MDWLQRFWTTLKNPDPFVQWVNSTFPSMVAYKYTANIYYILVAILSLLVAYILLRIAIFIVRKLGQVYTRIKAFFLKRKRKKLPTDDDTPSAKTQLFEWLKRIRELLNPEKEPIEEAFYESAKLLRQAFGDGDYMYELPWYIALGDSDSGKTTLLQSLDIKRPFGLGPAIEPLGLPIDWNYFDYGIVLDVRGDVIYQDNRKPATSQIWSALLRQLSYHRPRRPLDGIIVTISMEDLYGPKKLSALDMRQKAHVLYEKLVTIQNNLSMRLPVYVVVTKLDILPGFDAFIKSVPPKKLKNILGWSAPHGVRQSYSPSWLEDAATDTRSVINNIKSQAFTMAHKDENAFNPDELFVFTEEMHKVWDNLTTFSNVLFAENIYKDSHFLRGIYFTGGTETEKDYTANLELFVQRQPYNILFSRDMFVEKIFKEANIGFPSYEIAQSVWRHLTVGKGAMLSALAFSSLMSLVAYHQFKTSKENLYPVIQDIKLVMKNLKSMRDDGVNLTKDEMEDYNKHLDHFLNTVAQDTKFWGIFMPPSWFAGLKKDAYTALGAALDVIMVQNVNQQIQLTLNKLLAAPKDVSKLDATQKTVFDVVNQQLSEKANPIRTKYFQDLKVFTDSLALLEKVSAAYNNFFISRNKDDLFSLINDLFGYELNDQFKKNFTLYNWSIRTEAFEQVNLTAYKKRIQKNFEKLFYNFVTYGIEQNDSLKKVFGLNALLDDLADVDAYGDVSVEDFQNIFKTIQDVIDISYKTGDLAWIADDTFNPGQDYANFLVALKRIKVIDTKVLDQQIARVQASYQTLKEEISGSYSTLLEANVFNMKGGTFSANQELIDIKNHLDRFTDEAFMANVEKKGLATKEIPGKFILWDARHLANAEKILSNYYDFMEKGIEDYPQKLRPLLERVAKAKLHSNLMDLLAIAQYTVSTSIETIGVNPEERYKNQVRNFATAWTPLKKILTELSSVDEIPEVVSELNRFVTEQFIKILAALDDILNQEGLLHVKGADFKWWNGEGNPILLGFKATDSRTLEGILDTQFRRLGKLAKDYAKPSVNLLAADFLPLQSSERLLVRKWSSILEQAVAYEKKQAGNSLEKLITLYVQDLKDFKLSTAEKALKKLQTNADTGDFFLEQRADTLKSLLKRVDAIGGYKLLAQYQKVAEYFNNNLAGKHPFSDDPTSQDEVDVDSLKELFTLMETGGFSADDYVAAFKSREKNSAKFIDFYKQLETLRRLFKPFADGQTDVPAVSLQIYFHASPNREDPRARQMFVDEEFDFGTGVPFDKQHSGKKVVWTYGDPINLSFKLADPSAQISVYNQGDAHFSQAGKLTGMFSYEGQWALWRMLADKSDGRDKSMLSFEIPVEDSTGNKSIRTFIKVVLSSVDDKDGYTVAEYPKFPLLAPALSSRNLKTIQDLDDVNSLGSGDSQEDDTAEDE